MSAEINQLPRARSSQSTSLAGAQHAELLSISADGLLRVRFDNGFDALCECLVSGSPIEPALNAGDRLLVLPQTEQHLGVVLGRVGKYVHPKSPASPPRILSLEASEVVTLRCGQSSIDMRADGKVMIRGEDVLVRAKGTKRIRAGTVAIN